MSIIIQKDDQKPEWPEAQPFKKESGLKSYIIKYPDVVEKLLADNLRLMVVGDGDGKELTTSGGPIDILAVDQHGQIYILETKLDVNYSKRKVVAQAMDYAAALWRDYSTGVDDFIKAVNNKYAIDLESEMANFFKSDENKMAAAIDGLAESLENGSFKLIVLMDKIEQSLKDLILFINSNSQFDIYAIELKRYKKGQLTIIIPELYGTEVRKRTVGRTFTDSNPEDFWLAIETNKDLETASIKLLVDAIQSSMKDDADFKYKTNPAGKEVVCINTKKRDWYPTVLHATGKLVLRYGNYSLYHRANKILLERLNKNQLFLVKDFNPDKSSYREVKLIGGTSQKIGQLIALYARAMKEAENP